MDISVVSAENITKGKKAKLFVSYAFTQRGEAENKLLYSNAINSLGSYWDGKIIGSGLTLEEMQFLLPSVIGIPANNPSFIKEVTKYYVDYEVVFKGDSKESIDLAISLQDDSKPLSEKNLPVNIDDYLKYRFLRNHPEIAHSLEAARHFGKRYVLTDDVTEETAKRLKLQEEERADTLYYGLKDDKENTKRVALLLGISDFGKSHSDLLAELKIEKNKNQKKFISILEDEKLELKALIKKAEQRNVVKLINTTYFLSEENIELGLGMEEVVLHLSSKEGKENLMLIKARLNDKTN